MELNNVIQASANLVERPAVTPIVNSRPPRASAHPSLLPATHKLVVSWTSPPAKLSAVLHNSEKLASFARPQQSLQENAMAQEIVLRSPK